MKIKFQETINPDLGITILKAGLKFQVQCCYSNNIEKEYIVENKKNCLFNLKNIIYGDVIKKIKDLQYEVYCYKKMYLIHPKLN